MDLKKLTSGKLRAIAYTPTTKTLRVDLEGGLTLTYSNVPADTFRRFSTHASPWSFYRDNIEEDFHATQSRTPASASETANKAALKDFFSTPDNNKP